MREKIKLALKLKERIVSRNLSLSSFDKIPPKAKALLEKGELNPLLIHQMNVYPVELTILDVSTARVGGKALPPINVGETTLIVIPYDGLRYIFQCILLRAEGGHYEVQILDPRSEPRVELTVPVSAFLSFIPNHVLTKLMQNEHYHLLREVNISSEESYHNQREVFIYDLILDERSRIDEEFKKLVQRVFLTGFLKDLSRSGSCVWVNGVVNLVEEATLFYVRFEVPLKERELKFALFCLLKDLTHHQGKTFFHLNHLAGIKPELWSLIEVDLKKVHKS